MAQRVNVVLIDDLNPEESADETVTFGLDGSTYEIDLSDVHAKEIREAMSVYVHAARRVGGRKKAATGPASTSGPSAADIRLWAKENGYDVPDRGRVPEAVKSAYSAVH